MDSGFFDTLRGFKVTSRKLRVSDDDGIDRLNRYHTVVVIITLSIVVCAKQYIVGEPLQCWVPAQFTPAWEQYAENYCWVENTYFVRPNKSMPSGSSAREKYTEEIHYYQWVPFVLAIQALMFYIPNAFWRLLNWQTGLPLQSLMQKAGEVALVGATHKKENIDLLARHFTHMLIELRSRQQGGLHILKRVLFRIFLCGYSKSGTYLVSYYLASKLLYIVNLVLQFVLIDVFLGTKHTFFGFQSLIDLSQGRGWEENAHFPRVTYCDFSVRSVGHIRPYTLQCVLVINMFTEKIYIFLWFWFVLCLVATVISLADWVVWVLMTKRKQHFIAKFLADKPEVLAFDVELFVTAVKTDGIFILELIRQNVGDIVAKEIVGHLYDINKENMQRKGKDIGQALPLITLNPILNPTN